MKKVSIDPITRLEGHGKIDIFLDQEGEVAECYFLVPELRGFEKFCEGRPVEELPRILTRICGVCPEAHHMASAKACDAVYQVDIPPAAKKLRELLYSVFYVSDHTTHFYALGGPDFIVGPDAPAAERNILGVIAKAGLEAGKRVIRTRALGHEIIGILGGKAVHPVTSLPGGVIKPLKEQDRQTIEGYVEEMVDFARFTMKIFDNVVLADGRYVEMIKSDTYTHRTYSMGTVDERLRVNFYDGRVRIVDPEGNEFALFEPQNYTQVIAEHVEPWTYLKFPYLKQIGWKGFIDGKESGIYKTTPLARLNAAEGMATPEAQAEYERFFSTLGGKPVHATLATHWARVIELLYAAERAGELIRDPEITSPEVRTVPEAVPDEGVGCVEAPRGTLFHHYQTDESGIVRRVNLIVGTTNNHAAISMSIKKAARGLIRKGVHITEGVLNRIEMAFRAYDPCFACATHTLPGRMPLEVRLRAPSGEIIDKVRRFQ